MDAKDQIIELGRVLREEQKGGYQDSATPAGLEHYLTNWSAQANGALAHEPVQRVLELLAD